MISVAKFALVFDPPTLVVEYERASQSYVKKIRIKNLSKYSPSSLLKKLVVSYKELLGPEVASQSQLMDILTLLLSQSQSDVKTSSHTSKENNNPHKGVVVLARGDEVAPAHLAIASKYGDLNKVSEDTNLRAKQEMAVDFEKNRLRPGDTGFVYDKQVSNPTYSLLLAVSVHISL